MTNLFAQPVTLSQRTQDESVQSIPELRNNIALSQDKPWLASASRGGAIHLWDMAAHNPTHAITLTGVISPVLSLEFSAENRWLAAGALDGSAHLWDLTVAGSASQPVRRYEQNQPDQPVWDVALSPDGHWLATVTPVDSTVRLWDVLETNGDMQPVELTRTDGVVHVWAAAFSPDNRWLATAWSDRSVLLWDTTNLGSAPIKLDKPTDASTILGLSSNDIINFSPDGHWLATALEEGIVRLWDMTAIDSPAATPADPIEFVEPNNSFTAIAFSDDSRYLAMVSIFDTVRIWDLRDNIFHGEPIDLVNFGSTIDSVAFSNDNSWLVIGYSGGDIELRHWRVEDIIDLACRTVGRNMTLVEWKQSMGDMPYRPTCPQWPAAE